MPKDNRRQTKKARITFTTNQVQQAKKEKGFDFSLLKKIVAGLILLLGGFWTGLQIYNYYYPPKPSKTSAFIQLAIDPIKTNPTLYFFKDLGAYAIHTVITNSGNGSAFNLSEITKVVAIVDDSIFYVTVPNKPIPTAFNRDFIFTPNYIMSISSPFFYEKDKVEKNGYPKNQRTFFCLKINYSDSSNQRKHFIGIFETTGFPEKSSLSMANSDIYNRVDTFLIANKIW